MAQIRKPIHDDGPVNAGEQRLLDYLDLKLPSNYIIIPNLNIAITGQNRVMKYWEYDCIVVAPHAVYHIENKDWAGNLEGDDWAWFRSGQGNITHYLHPKERENKGKEKLLKC